MRLIIELPWLDENCKSQAKYAYKNVASPTNLLDDTHFYQGDIVQVWTKKLKVCSN